MLWVGLNLLFYDTLFLPILLLYIKNLVMHNGNNIETLNSTIYCMKVELQVEIENIDEQIYGVVFQ